MDNEQSKYLKAYYDNEVNANRHMSFASLFTGILLFLVWVGYVTKFFSVSDTNYMINSITIPFIVLILVSPMFFIKTKLLSKLWYKYFILILFVFAMGALAVIIPKHAVIGWAVCVVLTNHYYNPKVTRTIFIVVLVSMAACMVGGMFLGEFEPNLLTGVLDTETKTISHPKLSQVYDDTPSGRFEFLKALIEAGDNRYTKTFSYFYFGRALFISLTFYICYRLNKRTYRLFLDEIEVNSENQKNKTELEVAKEIQLNTLPKNTFTDEDIEILGELKAAKEIGGDFYDYFDIDEDHVAFTIGDVSGKGIPAAMFMMKTITCIKNFARVNKTPAEILKEVNSTIYTGDTQMFVTCFFAILDKRTGVVKFVNAGHNKPIIGTNKRFRFLKCSTGFVLGGLEDLFVVDEEFKLEPNESIVLYTDGITEARNKNGDFFGDERLINSVNAKEYNCSLELFHNIKDQVSHFVKDAAQSDDITLLTLKYHGDKYTYEEKLFKAQQNDIPEMLSFIEDFGKRHKFTEQFSHNMSVVGDEIFSNIVKYGYDTNDGYIFIRLLFNEDKKEFALTVVDRAKPFNQLEVNNSKVSENPEEQKLGGLGILIVKNLMTEYAYDRINDKNILVLKKKL